MGRMRRAVGRWLAAAALVAASGAALPAGNVGAAGAQALPFPGLCGEFDAVGAPGTTAGPDAVRELQLALRLLGRFPYPLSGVYDARTRDAVRAFQASAGLEADGVAGPRTLSALASALEEALDRQGTSLVAAQRTAASTAPPPHVPRHPDLEPGGPWVIVDTEALSLELYRGDRLVERWPVAVGKPGTITPVGEWRIVYKARDWGGGFGTRWLGLDVPWGVYGIHGTNKPWSIGLRASAGCIRMFNQDVERLWDMVPQGTPVTVVGILPEATWDSPIPPGATGWNVPVLQWALRRAGLDPGRADGHTGPRTMAAVAEAQRQWGLPAVAAATPDLFRALGLRR